jgi:hypothetical protein
MAKQTFSAGQVLTAAQMTSLQQTAMLGGAASAKTASYTLVAADAGTAISMSNASATTITVNTGLFAAGDTVQITNLGAGVCTITAGTATVNTAASLALAQYESGTLDFTSASAAIFIKGAGAAAGGGGKVLQVVYGSYATETTASTTTFVDTGLTATITPTSATSKVLAIVSQQGVLRDDGAALNRVRISLLRGATTILKMGDMTGYTNTILNLNIGSVSGTYLDAPATTSATTYKTQFASGNNTANVRVQTYYNDAASGVSTITLLEIGA